VSRMRLVRFWLPLGICVAGVAMLVVALILQDEIWGEGGEDYLDGDNDGGAFPPEGQDELYGGAHDDVLVGQGNDDLLVGGGGTDEGDGGNDIDACVVEVPVSC